MAAAEAVDNTAPVRCLEEEEEEEEEECLFKANAVKETPSVTALQKAFSYCKMCSPSLSLTHVPCPRKLECVFCQTECVLLLSYRMCSFTVM